MLFDASMGRADRMIVQSGGNPPVDMTQVMKIGQAFISSQSQQVAEINLKDTATLVNKESVTTPAGTFACSHYRSTAGSDTSDVWITESVRPYGLVRMKTSDGSTMELVKVLTNVSSQIPTL